MDGTHRLFTMPFSSPNSNGTINKDDDSVSRIDDIQRVSEDKEKCINKDNENDQKNCNIDNCSEGVTMWQLSFSGISEDSALSLKNSSHEELVAEALRRTKDWFSPVDDLIRNTLPGEAWATPLYDRDPMHLLSKQQGRLK